MAGYLDAIGSTKGTVGGVLAADLARGRDNPLLADMQALGTPSAASAGGGPGARGPGARGRARPAGERRRRRVEA